MISFEELHRKTLPEKKKKFVKVDVISYYLWRPLCDFISILLMPTNITPTMVTIFSFWMALLSLIIFILIPGKVGALLGYALIWLWNISDGIDGNIARYKEQFSKAGDLWDATAGYMAMVSFYFGAGLIAVNESSRILLPIESKYYIIFGAIAAICVIFPRLVVQKKNVVYGDEAVKSLKDRSEFSLIKLLMVNMMSINGLAGLLLFIAILLQITNLFIVVYFVIQILFFVASMVIAMKDL
ncbi:CDP-alcohol phosphatidyltransferase family protein [Ligilactobacillus saerimneri]|uniref:CDP-alcohol phosphatidyltransferase family protein n=1 Tax=Ligilactobacillus saerimneri TaxID=228229 RepID=UPI0024308277|nr:CDP-alcohol phosphatidyltransferase family protein [Ligilactobacillus saerimneri]